MNFTIHTVDICYKWIYYTDINTGYIQNNNKMENKEFYEFENPFLKFVQIYDFPQFLKFLKFALSIYDSPWVIK